MGGGQTLNIGFAHLDQFGYIGVFSSGILGGGGRRGATGAGNPWEEQQARCSTTPRSRRG